jgi:lysozyme
MNTDRLIAQLIKDEGKRLKVYKDSLGYRTVGIGHCISDDDPEEIRNLEHRGKITEAQCWELFTIDLSQAIHDCIIVFNTKWLDFPDEARETFINMMFNLGRTRFLKFKNTIAAAYEGDWNRCADEMLDSKWATQVGMRSKRLASTIRRLAD